MWPNRALRVSDKALRLAGERTGGRCAYCGRLTLRMTIDHVVPKGVGGGNDSDNLLPACIGCNSWKRDSNLEQFRSYMAQRELGMPGFNLNQIEWLREAGIDLKKHDDFHFFFEKKGGEG